MIELIILIGIPFIVCVFLFVIAKTEIHEINKDFLKSTYTVPKGVDTVRISCAGRVGPNNPSPDLSGIYKEAMIYGTGFMKLTLDDQEFLENAKKKVKTQRRSTISTRRRKSSVKKFKSKSSKTIKKS